MAKQNFETRFKEHANAKKYFDMTEYDINDEIQNYNSKILLAGIHAICTLFAQTWDNYIILYILISPLTISETFENKT